MSETPEQHDGRPPPRLARDLPLYLLARFGLIVVVAVIPALFGVPLLVSVALGFLVGLPLGLVLLRPLNRRVTAGLSVRRQRRERQRAQLRAQLRGDSEPEIDETRDRQDTGNGDGRGEDSQ